MSTSTSTVSGMMFVFCPPLTTFGENVVWVQAWQVRATGVGSCSSVDQIAEGSIRPARSSSGRSMDATWAPHTSSRFGAGRYSFRRRTISAALTSALSAPKGIEP